MENKNSFEQGNKPLNIQSLLDSFREGKKPIGEIMEIRGIKGGKDVYNITAPFEINGIKYILGREENESDQTDSKMVWIMWTGGNWEIDRNMPSIKGEDPCITKIINKDNEKEIVIGLVRVNWNKDKLTNWKMDFFKGKNFDELKKSLALDEAFTSGPEGMKDIRLVSLPSGKIGVFTRPQGGKFGPGKIGYIELDSLNELNEENIQKAEILENLFKKEEWGGVNEVHILENGYLGVLAHIAHFTSDKIRYYYSMAFELDPSTKKITNRKIIAEVDNFPPGVAKRDDLKGVIYSGGLIRHNDGSATLYGGVRDKEAGMVKCNDPFI